MLHYCSELGNDFNVSPSIDEFFNTKKKRSKPNARVVYQADTYCAIKGAKHMLNSMDRVDIGDKNGIWFITSQGWKFLIKLWKQEIKLGHDAPFDIEARTEMTRYQGILGYYRGWRIGWRIQLGMAPKYGVTYIIVDEGEL